ncbi:putative asparagine synthase (glutamine-hydrolyzing) [Helianthus annuus]|nr:putative asparagine synthase (glutamine-hydrolyzing) [Helianthus annuus]
MILKPKGLKHRGPDWSGLYQHGDNYLSHQRLAVIDPASGDQPLSQGTQQGRVPSRNLSKDQSPSSIRLLASQ